MYYSDQSVLPDQRAIARELAHEMIHVMRYESAAYNMNIAQAGMPHKPLYAMLNELVDVLWMPHTGAPDPSEEANRALLYKKLCEQVPPHIRSELADALAHFGHLHQMAGLLARDALLEHASTNEVERFLHGTDKSDDKKIAPRMRVQDAVEALSKPRIEMTLTAHPTNTSSVESMVTQRELGKTLIDWRAGKADRTQMLAALKHFAKTPLLPMVGDKTVNFTVPDEIHFMLSYLGNIYEDMDGIYAQFDDTLSAQYPNYKPEALKLNLGFHSWGSSGDKDGNNKVTADTTLLAIAAHRHAILHRYEAALEKLLPQYPQLEAWQTYIHAAAVTAFKTEEAITAVLKKQGHLSAAEFTQYSDALSHAQLDEALFIKSLEGVYAQDTNPELLSLLRKARIFGFGFGSIEYRETAEEYTRVVGELIPGYLQMDEAQRVAALNHVLEHPDMFAEAVKNLRMRFNGVVGKAYSTTDVLPIAYHTLKRMELARDFPDMIQNNVLAECQNTSNFLEALVLQHAVADAQGKRAKLGIIPLFEEHSVLQHSPEIVRSALENPHYAKHLHVLGDKAVQQVQLAHSDNARRAGMPAARGLIFAAHQNLRDMVKEYNQHASMPVKLQFFEGGSQSDPYRGGVRPITASVKEFGLQEFSKMTFQGGDLLNYLNLPMASERLFVRGITHNAQLLQQEPQPKPMSHIDRRVVEALKGTQADYVRLFEDPGFSEFMDRIGYRAQAKAGGNTSRAAARKTSDGVVNVNAMRTIGFSETLQHAGIAPTWLGMRNLAAELQRQFPERTIDAPFLHQCYETSPIFRDVIDRMLYGLVKSDIAQLEQKSGNHVLMGRIRSEYGKAYQLCIESVTGEPMTHIVAPGTGRPPHADDPMAMRRTLIKHIFPHVADNLGDQWRYVQLARAMQKEWVDDSQVSDDAVLHVRNMLLHNMIDTVHHGRHWLLDDPSAAKLHCQHFGIERVYANGIDKPQARSIA